MISTLQKFFLISLICFLSSFTTNADDKVKPTEKVKPRNLVKPIRIGYKFGLPNIVGFGTEYVLPYKSNSFGINFDCSIYTTGWEEYFAKTENGKLVISNTDIVYWNLSANYYVFGEGSGLYLGLGFCQILRNTKIKNFYSDQLDVLHDGKYGTINVKNGNESATSNINGFPIKIGYKWIFWYVSIGLEAGAAFASINNDVPAIGGATVVEKSNDFPELSPGMYINFNDYKRNVHFYDDLPSLAPTWVPLLALSIGIAL